MKTWSVWREGYCLNEGPAPAEHLGEWPGETFADACVNWAAASPNYANDVYRFDPEHLTWWGCRLFDNENGARRFMG